MLNPLSVAVIHAGIGEPLKFNFCTSHILVEEIYKQLAEQISQNSNLEDEDASFPEIQDKITLRIENCGENWKILNPKNYLDDYNILAPNGQPIILRSKLSVEDKLLGGKGGFGSLLKGQAQRAGQKKTTNFSSCRDLNGRRLRTVENERNVESINEEKKKREELKSREKKRKEGLKQQEDEKLKQKINSDLQNQAKTLKSALSMGVSKRKREDFEENESSSSSSAQKPTKKRKKMMFDDDEEEEEESKEEEEEKKEETEKKDGDDESSGEEDEITDENEEENEEEIQKTSTITSIKAEDNEQEEEEKDEENSEKEEEK